MKTFYLSSAVLLAGAMGVAQASRGGSSQDQDSSMAGQAAGAQLRGCLTGSDGNYTLTDHNGAIYHLVGGAAQLRNAVGHEVEVTGTPDARRTGAGDDTAANTASSFQVTSAREEGARCDHGSASGKMNDNSHPMSEQPPNTDHQPKGAPGEGVPPQTEPHPELMAMLQQPGSTDTGGTSSQSNGTPPPVTSQTPAASQSPTDPNSQLGTGTASQTGTSTAAGASAAGQTGTGSSATGATAATASPTAAGSAGATGTTGSSDMNNGTPAVSTASTGASATATSPQSTQNDANKPLYERQATDVPWASHSGSTTTTTTPEPH
jgi:hypothetical protein